MPGLVEAAESTVTRGTVLSADGSLPVVVHRRLGRGSIWFLAFDPGAAPASLWDGTLSMWRAILEGDRVPALGAAARPAPVDSAVEDPWISALFESSQVSFPSVAALLVFIGAYFALLVVLLVGRPERRMKGRVRLVLLAAASICACAAGWAAFNRLLFDPGLQVVDVSKVDARSGDGLAFATEKAGFFSASAGTAETRMGTAGSVLETAAWRERSDGPWSTAHLLLSQAGAVTMVRGPRLERLSSRLVVFQDVVPFTVSVSVAAAGSVVRTSVSNGNARPLRECYILTSGRAYSLGDIAAGGSVQKTFNAADGLENPPGTSARSAADGSMFKDADRRFPALFTALDSPASSSSGPARLVGWMDGPALSLSFPGSRPIGDRPGLSLVSVEAE